MKNNIENYHKIGPNRELFYQIWPCSNAKATVFITHGIGEHSDCYEHVARFLNKNNIQVFAWDLQGHGRSSGQRGYVNQFKDHCTDLKKMLKFLNSMEKYNNLPVILLGHSMGGAITLRSYIEQKPKSVAMLCLSSPVVGIKQKIHPAKEALAQLANKYLPRLSLNNDINYENLSTIPEQLEFYKQDNLRHSRINARTFLGLKESFEIIFKKQNKLQLPILFLTSKNDPVVDADKTQKLFNELQNEDKMMHLYENSMHEVFNDVEKEQVLNDLFSFIQTHLN